MKIKKISTSALAILLILAIIGTTASITSAFGIKLRNFFSTEKECVHTLVDMPGQAPTCTDYGWDAYYTCTQCNYNGKQLIAPTGHSLAVNLEYGDFADCTCVNCSAELSFGADGYYRVMTMTNRFGYSSVDGNSANFIVAEGTQNPVLNALGQYQFIKEYTTADYKQAQMWLPSDTSGFSGFSSDNGACGVLSFKLEANVSKSFEVILVEGAAEKRWSEEWCITNPVISIIPYAYMNNYAEYTILGCDGAVLKTVKSTFNAWTDEMDIIIGIEFDRYNDRVMFHYYIDGEYLGVAAVPLTTMHNSISSVYFSGKTAQAGSGYKIRDLAFCYATSQDWIFN